MNPASIATLEGGGYLDAGEQVVLLGDSGTGKSRLLIGLGMAACEQGRSVRYVTCAQLVNELAEAADEKRLAELITRYGRVELMLLDERGYVKLDTRGAELLFQILTEREERSSIATAPNLPFSEWGKVVTDARHLLQRVMTDLVLPADLALGHLLDQYFSANVRPNLHIAVHPSLVSLVVSLRNQLVSRDCWV